MPPPISAEGVASAVGALVGAGGVSRGAARESSRRGAGVHLFVAPSRTSALLAPSEVMAGDDGGWRHVATIPGNHSGCVERRPAYAANGCEFDGKLSLVWLRGALLLYARANLHPTAGGRFVQVTRSASGDPAGPWAPFTLIAIRRYEAHAQLL